MQDRWAPELVRIVAQINDNFGANFRDIASAGEVSLGILGHANDAPLDFNDPNLNFEKLAIHVKVKFRDTEGLQLLTTSRQSGGERALTTMLYLIAIQVSRHADCVLAAVNARKQMVHLATHMLWCAQPV